MISPVQHSKDEVVSRKLPSTNLEQVQVGIHHGVTEVALDVRHRLPLDLQPISYPHAT